MRERLYSAIGFSDSELVGYYREESALLVRVRSWNEKAITLRFSDVICLRDMNAGAFSDVILDAMESLAVLQEALRRNYETVPSSHPYRVYAFMNHDDEPSLEVVAAGCDVNIEEP